MRENCKKSLFLGLLIFTLLIIGYLSTMEDLEKISDTSQTTPEIDSSDQESTTPLLKSNQSHDSNNSSFSQLIETLERHDFVGRWHQKSLLSTNLMDFFDSTNGKARFAIMNSRNITHRLEIYLYDGEYIDGKFLWFRFFDITGSGDNVETNSSILIENLTAIAYFHSKYEIIKRQEIENISLFLEVSPLNVGDGNYNEKDLNVKIEIFSNNASSLWFESEMKIDENLYQKTIRYAIMVGIVAIVHSFACFALIKKILENESEGNAFSLISLAFVAIWDMYLCIVNFLLAVKVEAYFQFLVTPAFCYFALFTVFETRLLMLVWKAKYFPGQSNLDQLRNSLFKFYLKFYFWLTVLLLFANNFITSTIFLFVINLYLIPQIVHSAIKGQLMKPNKIYLFGLMLPRSFLLLYLKGCPYGLFEMTPSYIFLFFTILILALQIIIIYLQEYYGPRYLLPKFLFPKSFDYFLDVPDRDLEMDSAEPNEDCVICLNPLHHEPSVNNPNNNSENNSHPAYYRRLGSQKKVMQTPCLHKFHSPCLLNWMTIKMECPTCRTVLPVL